MKNKNKLQQILYAGGVKLPNKLKIHIYIINMKESGRFFLIVSRTGIGSSRQLHYQTGLMYLTTVRFLISFYFSGTAAEGEFSMKHIISNAFSANMISETKATLVLFNPISAERAALLAKSEGWESSLGHNDITNVVNTQLGTAFVMNRRTDVLETGDIIMLAQYKGARLPEGATALPEGAKIAFFMVISLDPAELGINPEKFMPGTFHGGFRR